MRHTIVHSIVLLLASAVQFNAYAQSAPTPTILGVHGGLSYATLSGGDGSLSSRSGFVIGAYMDQNLSGQWSLQPEIQYIQKGTTTSTDGSSADVRLQYVEVPVFLRLNGTRTASGVLPYAQLGPEISFKTGCDGSGSTPGGFTVSTSCDAIGLDVSSTDFGIVGGVGLDMTIGGHVFTGVARYDLGLKSISEGGDKNRAFTLLVGLRF